ncbi:hypothetical protein Bca52824_014811 [Brassica carinata]|uniref:Uncharacterized protein n=1 Tax=Brassica carinata TaxID=52824 RepID=A0A8X7W3P5_BRACI|nr:hypothetical protein Bca52824_014811 [Brassica carinata]
MDNAQLGVTHSTPEVTSSDDDSATVLSLQITSFPGQGFSIGVSAHHAVSDGKTSTMFVKAWAHFCKQENGSPLPETLTPCLDRSLIKDPTGLLHEQMVEIVRSLNDDDGRIIGNRRNLSSIPAWERGDDGVFATLVLSRGDAETRAKSERSARRRRHGETRESPLRRGLQRATRSAAPATYFELHVPAGCFSGKTAGISRERGFCGGGDPQRFGERLEFEKDRDDREEFKIGFDCVCVTPQLGRYPVARLGVMKSDFGWGRPVKVDVVSIESNTISIARDVTNQVALNSDCA